MLKPVLVRANYKIATAEIVTLESIVGSNLPLLFPELVIMNRTAAVCSLTVSGEIRNLFTNQSDPDFDGSVLYTPFSTFAVGDGQVSSAVTLQNSLLPANYGITTEITLTNSGPAAEVLVSLVLRGMIESSVTPDPLVIVNV